MASGPFPEDCAARFAPVEPLASGGFGAVWRGVQLALDRPVAIKVLHESAGRDPVLAARFDREARVTATLVHPAIVTVIDHGNAHGVPWIAFELLPGPSLRERLAAGRLALDEVLAVGAQVAGALAAGHAAGILHRDVKPENVVGAGGGAYKVVDFGIAAFAGGEGSIQTASGMILGTPAYVSPERVSGQDAEPASDVYALGCMLHELVAGRPPFLAGDVGSLLVAHVKEPAPRLAQVQPGTPAPLVDLVAGMLEKSPAARPTAAQVAAQLEGLRAAGVGRRVTRSSRTVRPRTTGAAPTVPAEAPAGRRTASVALAVLAALGLAALALRTAGAPPRSPPSPSAMPSTARGSAELAAILTEAEDAESRIVAVRKSPRFAKVPSRLVAHGSSGDGLMVVNAPTTADLDRLKVDFSALMREHDPLSAVLLTLGDRAEALAVESPGLAARARLASLHARAFVEWNFGQLMRARMDRITNRRQLSGSLLETVGSGLPYEDLTEGKRLLRRFFLRLVPALAEQPRTPERVPDWAVRALSRARWALIALATAVRQNPANAELVASVEEQLIRLEREGRSGRELSGMLVDLLVLELGDLEHFRKTRTTQKVPDHATRLEGVRGRLEALRARLDGSETVIVDLLTSLEQR